MHTLPNLDELRQKLRIEPVNTGREVRPLGRAGPVSTDIEGLHAIVGRDGKVYFRAGTEFGLFSFRGQNAIYKPCVPTIARIAKPSEKLLAWCRNVAFVDALLRHPYVRLSQQARFPDREISIDFQAMAQHYGLATNLLDTTNSFDVACFFASCTNLSGEWEPVVTDSAPDNAAGVIYLFPRILFDEPTDSDAGVIDRHYDVGWQPLQRTHQQRASAFVLLEGEDFAQFPGITAYPFRHSRSIAEQLLEQFNGGADLFPEDETVKLAQQAQILHHFTEQQINQALVACKNWFGKELAADEKAALLRAADVMSVADQQLLWSDTLTGMAHGEMVNRINSELGRVRVRWTY